MEIRAVYLMLILVSVIILATEPIHSGDWLPLAVEIRNTSGTHQPGLLRWRLDNAAGGMWRIWSLDIDDEWPLADYMVSLSLPNDLPDGEYTLWTVLGTSEPVKTTFSVHQARVYRVYLPGLQMGKTAEACLLPC